MSSHQTGRALLRADNRKSLRRREVNLASRRRKRFLTLETLHERAMFVVYFSEDFADNSAGWTLDTEWEIGAATASSGHDPFEGLGPDPGVDTTPTADNGIAGVVIGGNATTSIHAPYYLTSPVIDTSGATNLSLKFNRWLNSDYLPYAESTVDVFDGGTWVNVWANGTAVVTDTAWSAQNIDILAYSNANLQIRFGYEVAQGGTYLVSCWNLDDVVVESVSAQSIPFTEDFSDNSAGWSLGTQWQIGSATASSGHQYGGPDPSMDTSPTADNGIAGVVIGGNATTAIHGYYYFTTPVIDTTSASGALVLRFNRWLNSDYTPYMQNTIEVFDGSSWIQLFITGGSPGVQDTSWQAIEYDLLPYSNAALQVRFGVQVAAGGAYLVSSWNLDDVFIGSPPNNDNFANPNVLPSLQTTSGTGTNVGYTSEAGEPATYPAAHSTIHSAWWTWTAPVSGTVQIDTIGSTFDTTLGVYTGAAVNALTLIAANDDFSGLQSGVTFTAVAGTVYRIRVEGYGTSTGNIVVNVQQVNDQFARAFTITGLNVTTTGHNNTGATGQAGEPNNAGVSAPLQSLWWNWTSPITGVVEINTQGSTIDTTLGVYTGTVVNALTTIGSNDDYYGLQSRVLINAVAGTTYRISVDSYTGAQGPIVLNIVTPNDSFSASRVLNPLQTVSATGSNVGFTGETGEPNNAGISAPIQSAWWSWTSPVSGTVEVNTQGSNYDTSLGVYTGTAVNALTTIGANDDFYGLQSRVVFTATAGTTYHFSVDSYSGGTGNIVLNVLAVNDLFARAFTLTGSTVTGTGSNVGATAETGEPTNASAAPIQSNWWYWTAPVSAPTEINTVGSNYDTSLGVYTGTAVNALTLIGTNDDYPGYGLRSAVLFNAVAGTTYRISVDSFSGGSGLITLNIIQTLAQDFSDAPASYGTASHTGTGATLGATRDTETAVFNTSGANGDDLNGSDDEDGVTFGSMAPGGNSLATVNVQGVSGTVYLQGWIDFNNDGTFGAGEQIATNMAITANGNVSVPFAVPSTAVVGNLISRFRVSTVSGLGATGTAANGEVEDHLATVAIPTTVYVNPTFTTVGASVDGDLTAAGVQSAIVGYNAFATVTQALAVVANNGVAILNTATYAEAPTVTKPMAEIRGYGATLNSLTTNASVGLSGTFSASPGGYDFNNPVTLVGNTILNAAAAVDFTGANVNATAAGAQSLTITAAPAAVTLAGVGNTTAVNSLTVSANVLTGPGNLSTTAGISATVASASSISGIISGAGSLTKLGAGSLTISGTNTYTGITSVNAGTLTLQNGAAILDTAGAVSVAQGATLQLLNSETISSYNGAGDIGVGTDDSTLALGNFTLTTTGAAAIANVTVGTGGLVAGTSITDTDDDNNVTGSGLFMQAAAGIGIAANPIETTLANLEASGGTGGVFIANTGNLVVGGVSALVGVSATGGDIVLSTAGSLTVNENVTATGSGTDVTLSSIDAAAAGQNLSVTAGVTVSSAAATVLINSGDDATITGNITSGTTTTINVDVGNADAGTGGSLAISGVITTPVVGSGGGAFLNGQTDNDTFTFNPQTTTEFRVFGDAPIGVTPGDTLVMNVTATTNPNLTVPGSLAPYSGIGSGAWSFTSAHRPVLFGSIEQSTITGNYHLTYDNSVAPVGNLIVMRDASQANLQLRSGTTSGTILYQGSLGTILSLRILGSTGNDTVTVDDINTLPNFAGTVPGVTDNGNLTGTAELLFDGLGGTDTLIYNVTGASASQQYAIGNGSGTAGFEGEVSTTAAAVNLIAYFQSVESVTRTGTGTTPGGLSVIGDSSSNAFTMQASGASTQVLAPGYSPFTFSGNNYTSLAIDALGGADSIELVSLGTAQTNNPTITLSGGAQDDTIRVHSTSGNTGIVTLNGNAGNDLFLLYNILSTVDAIVGPVVVDGSDGNVMGNTDTLTIIDSGDTTADNVLVSAVNAATSPDYAIEGINATTGNDVVFRNIDDLNYTGTSGNDTIDGRFVNTIPLSDLSMVSLSGWLGSDQFLLFTSDQFGGSGAGVTPTGVASGVASISLYGDAPGNPNLGDGTDTFGATPAGVVGTGVTNVGIVVPDTTRLIRPSASTAIIIDGGEPSGSLVPQGDVVGDVSNVDISALPNTTPVIVSTFSPGSVLATGIQPLTWTQIEDLNLVDQGKLTNTQVGDLFSRTTPGNDLIQLTVNSNALNPNQVRLRISTQLANFTVTNKTIMYGGGGNDTLTQSNLPLPAEFYGEDGDDYLSGAMNNDWLVGGMGNDQINGSGGNNIVWGDNSPTLPTDGTPQDLVIGGNDKLSGLGGSDIFYGGGGDDEISAGGGNDYVYGGEGNDTLDGNDGDDRVYGGTGSDVLAGSAGNDLISGEEGDDFIYGGTGNDVLIGGFGTDLVDGGDGNDLMISGSVANDSSAWTSFAIATAFTAPTYTSAADNDFALMTLLSQWGSASDRSSLGAITHDGVDDDLYGGLGDDDMCWENLDVLDDFPAPAGADFNAPLMGNDERFGPS